MGRWTNRIAECFRLQNGRCVWCGVEMDLVNGADGRANLRQATWDHFYNSQSKLRSIKGNAGYAACRLCNCARGTFDLLLHNRGIDISDIWDKPDIKRLSA